MRTRLVAAIVIVALLVLGASYLTTFVLVRRALEKNALNSLQSRADDLRTTVNEVVTNDTLNNAGNATGSARQRIQLRNALRLTDMRAVYVTPACR